MTVGRLLLWRHGRTAFNATARLQGQVDIPLDDVGRWQARTAAAAMLVRHTPTRIVSSDLGRAVETADPLARMAGVDVETDERVRERSFGEWEGLSGPEIAERWPEDFALWRSGGEPERVGAETRLQVAKRTAAAIDEHAQRMAREETLVVVSHGAAISSAVAELMGLPADWRALAGMHNAHWAELVPSSSGILPAWRLVGYNLGPTDASADWNAGPDRTDEHEGGSTRDPD
ncbi:histidine phosphatase family protein [Cellulomonas palmilytica]|uniref:histidine phosphatase family protein n=1 Tax=Cellulomonas palmilytica TaxID=2608402 RepID=UPI001F44F50C|nr:histidine phosphatase family protein [Cellulomonas palmilytica]UJP39446.1 histidine phosphatase family protein [Cellulomonas palmilytica]